MTFFKAEELTVEFGGIRALDHLSFEVKKGEIYSIIGPNGAGKTTIFNLISRFYSPTLGCLFFEDQPITHLPPHQIAKLGIARTFQNIELFGHATVLQNLMIGRHIYRKSNLLSELLFLPSVRKQEYAHRKKVEEVIELLEIQPLRDQYIANLPYGSRKLVELARALCLEPKLLLLDEPSSGLNPEETEDISFWIEDINRELGVTIMMIEHNMGLVSAVSHRVLAVHHGCFLAEGSPQEVQHTSEVIRVYLGGGAHDTASSIEA